MPQEQYMENTEPHMESPEKKNEEPEVALEIEKEQKLRKQKNKKTDSRSKD